MPFGYHKTAQILRINVLENTTNRANLMKRTALKVML
jgi:hypothetical protein